jgi:preprotein translocase subunit SecD
VLGVVATAARAEDSPAASRCELKGVPTLQPAAPPGPFASVRNHVLGWVFPREQPDAALAGQGGLRLVLRADTDAFRAELLDDLRDEVRCLMREARIAHGNLAVRDGSIELQLRENFDLPRALAALALAVPAGQPPGALDMRDTGNGLIQLTPTAAAYDGWLRDALERTAETIERRMQELGIASAGAQRDGPDRIVVVLPGAKDAIHLQQVAAARGRLQFRLVDTSISPQEALNAAVPSGSELVRLAGSDEQFLLRREVALTGRDIVDAEPGFFAAGEQPVVTFRFTERGARAFGLLTQENVGRPIAIVFDREVLSAPIIREPILGGVGQISGRFTVQQANDLAVLLRTGTLPLDLIPVEQKSVAPAPK